MTEKTNTELFNTIATVLDEVFNKPGESKKVAFVLLVMPFDGPKGARVNYVSNGNRENVTEMLEEVTARRRSQTT